MSQIATAVKSMLESAGGPLSHGISKKEALEHVAFLVDVVPGLAAMKGKALTSDEERLVRTLKSRLPTLLQKADEPIRISISVNGVHCAGLIIE